MSEHDGHEQSDASDEALLGELRGAIECFDPLPARLGAAARAAFSWWTIDAELAALTHDTLLDNTHLAMMRSGDTPRLLTFDGNGLSAELEATDVGRRRRLAGQLVPPQFGEVKVVHPGGETRVEVDESGCFVVHDLRPGPVRVTARMASGRTFQTPWLLI